MKYPEKASLTLESKKEIPQNDQIIKTIIGFCNQHGGKLVLGVEDDGTIVGIDEEKVQEMLEYFKKAILEASYPPIITRTYTQRVFDKTLLFIEVDEGMNKPYYLKRDGKDKGIYIRLGRSTMRANDDMIDELGWQARGISFDSMPVYKASLDDLNKVKIKEFLATRRSNQGQSKQQVQKNIPKLSLNEAMLAYKIAVQEFDHWYPTVAGILLFGKNPQYFFPEARIMCNQFFRNEIEPEVVASQECLGTLDEQFNTAYHFVLSRLHWSWEIIGPKRHEELEIPKQAVREIIMNAVIHRNYHIPGPNKIAIFNNRIEIFSQGNFPGPLGENLRSGFTYLRNLTICKIIREMGLIENFGVGFITTFSSYEKAGLRAPEVVEGEQYVICSLPRKTTENMLRSGSKDDLPIELNQIIELFFSATDIAVSDVMAVLHLTRPTAVRRLTSLVKKGLLKKIGKGRGVRYEKS